MAHPPPRRPTRRLSERGAVRRRPACRWLCAWSRRQTSVFAPRPRPRALRRPPAALALRFGDLAPAVVTVRRDVMAPVCFAGLRVRRQRGLGQGVVGPPLVALGARHLVLLYRHLVSQLPKCAHSTSHATQQRMATTPSSRNGSRRRQRQRRVLSVRSRSRGCWFRVCGAKVAPARGAARCSGNQRIGGEQERLRGAGTGVAFQGFLHKGSAGSGGVVAPRDARWAVGAGLARSSLLSRRLLQTAGKRQGVLAPAASSAQPAAGAMRRVVAGGGVEQQHGERSPIRIVRRNAQLERRHPRIGRIERLGLAHSVHHEVAHQVDDQGEGHAARHHGGDSQRLGRQPGRQARRKRGQRDRAEQRGGGDGAALGCAERGRTRRGERAKRKANGRPCERRGDDGQPLVAGSTGLRCSGLRHSGVPRRASGLPVWRLAQRCRALACRLRACSTGSV